ncbi:MAG: hypothetical protein K8S23_14925 [Candidatus Cloacimonetes bacterium]|nr:hypothetical protein [Candidatus Cloacimonadota bacterium]
MKYFILIIMLIITTPSVFAIEFDLFGYYENQTTSVLNNKPDFLSYNKLRLDFAKEISSDISFNSNLVFQTYHGKTSICLLDYLTNELLNSYSQEIGISIDDLKQSYTIKSEDEIFLDNAFLSLYQKHFNLRSGKQQIALGTGYAWNPTDIYNAKNIFDPTYEKRGVNALKLEIPFTSEGMISSIVAIGENWEETTKSVHLKLFLFSYDFELSYARHQHNWIDYYSMNQNIEDRDLFGFSFSGALFGIGIWSETAFNKMSDSDDYYQGIIGADFTFENGLYLMSEYYYNGLGKQNENDYQFANWMSLFTDGTNLGRDYLYLGESYSIGELIEWSNYIIVNLNDKSFTYTPWLSFSLNDNVDFYLTANIPYGNDNSEFSQFEENIAVRLKVYF